MIFCAECGNELDNDDLCPECDYDPFDDDGSGEFLDDLPSEDDEDYEEVEREAIEDERL